MPIRVDYSAWDIRPNEIRRRFDYTDKGTGKHVATLDLLCGVEMVGDKSQTVTCFVFSPFRVVDGMQLGLSVVPADSRVLPVSVDVTSVLGGEGCMMMPTTPGGKQNVLNALLAGTHLKFGIFQGHDQLVDMPLYNDSEFPELYKRINFGVVMDSLEQVPAKKKGWFGLW